ncbi:MAG: hypothetical protein RLZZ534_1312, partial [Actinomycetota bacterium]
MTVSPQRQSALAELATQQAKLFA